MDYALYPLPARESVLVAGYGRATSPPPLSLLYSDLNQQAMLADNNRIYYLPGFYIAVCCSLAIDTPVPCEDHIDKDPARLTPSYRHFFCLSVYRALASVLPLSCQLSPNFEIFAGWSC